MSLHLNYNYALYQQYEEADIVTYIHFPYKWAIAAGIPHPEEKPAMVNPCCCMSLQRGVKFVAVISLIWSLVLIAEEIALVAVRGCHGIDLIQEQNPEFTSLDADKVHQVHIAPPALHKAAYNLTIVTNHTSNHSSSQNNIPNYDVERETLVDDLQEQTRVCAMKVSELIVSAMWVLTWIGDIGLAIMLIIGAYKKSTKLCAIWFHIRCAILVFRIIFLIIYVVAGRTLLYKIPVMVLFLFRIYSLWVVSHFIDEMKHEKEAMQKPRVSVTSPSTKQDLEKFASTENVVVPPGMTPLW